MLSPVIKTKNFNKDSGLLRASIDNLPIGRKIYIKFSNLDFNDVTNRIEYDDDIKWDLNNEKESIGFSFTLKSQSDRFLFVQIKILDQESWSDFGVASLIVKEEEIAYDNSIISVSKSYISKDDKLEIYVKAEPNSIYDLKINDKSFGFKTNNDGFSSLFINPINFIEQSIINSKFVRSVLISLSSRVGNKEIAKTRVEFVPESLYALAATNDPSRPSCVILDPDPVPAFSVSSDPLSDFCYDQPLVGKAFKADGSDASDTTRIDSNYINCSNGYVSSAINVVESACKIYDSPKFVRFNQPLNYENFASPSSESPALRCLFGDDWIYRRFGFCYSACDSDVSEEGVPVDPCSFSSKELRKIPRIWVGAATDAIGVSVSSIARGIIKAPPSYFHSIILKSNQISNGEAVNVIFDLSSGERISKTLVYDSEIHANPIAFFRSFASSISSDSLIVSAGISVDFYETTKRIDVKSKNEFYIYPGQIESVKDGKSVKNDKIQVIKNSKYAFDFEVTDPSRIDDINNMLSKNDVTHLLFLSGSFKGMMVPINKNEKNGNIVLDTCPRVSGVGESRSGLGAFIVNEDLPCTYVALVSLSSEIPADSSVNIKRLPFVKNRFNEVIPSINPCMTSDGRVFCQAMIAGKWQIFGYFPPSVDSFGSNSINENYWVQLTDIGENRNVSAASDYYGNIHLCWETDRFGFTSLQYSCIGKSQKLIGRLAMSGLFSKQIPPDLFTKIFSLNKNKVVDNFDQSQSSNINIIREGGIISLVPGANVTGKSFSIVREFTGYLKISDSDFEVLLEEEEDAARLGRVVWNNGKKPIFDRNTFVTSYLVHFDKRSSRIPDTESSSFTANFKGKVLDVFFSGRGMSKSGKFLKSSLIRYPSQEVSFDSSVHVGGGLISVTDENTVSFTFEYSGDFDVGPLQMRILVEGVYEQESIDQSEWNRIYSGDGKVSVSSPYDVCINGSPYSDVSLGVVSINKDYSGNYIEGQEYNLDFSVNCNVSISPSFPVSKFISGPELKVLDPQYSDLILERQDSSYIWMGDSEPIIVIEEFSGEPGFEQPIQYSSSFSYGGVRFEDSSKKYLPGFSPSSNVFSISLSIRSPELQDSVSKSILLDSPIVAIYIDETDLEYTDPILGNSVPSRTGYADIQNVKFSISKSRKLLNITLPSQTEIDFSIRVVLGGDLIVNPFKIKSDSELVKMFDEFSESFEQRDGSVFSFNNNRFTISKTEKRYDTFMPIMGSLKFDDLNSNPKADFSKFSNLSQLSSSTDLINAVGCENVSANETFEMFSNFKVDGVDSNLHHCYLFIVPERVSFVAKNSETLDEYSLRNGSIKGYREAIVTDIYTGFAKMAILSSGFYSAGLDTSFSRGVQLKLQDTPSVDISGQFSLQVDFSYLRLSKEDAKLVERWSHPAEDAFFIPSGQKPFYHLMANVYVNNYPQISANVQVDLSSKSRQWDFGFGMPFGLNPVCRSENINVFELLSKEDWEISFSNIKIGSPTVVINREYFENAENNYSFGKILSLVPNSDSNIENDTFNQSIIDPGDWVCLENDNLLIDEWRAINGGFIYSGSYVNSSSGSRSIILESNVPYSLIQNNSYYHLPMNSQRRGRVSSGCFGGISQDFGTFSKDLDYEHYINMTFGLRPLPEQLPKVMKSILIYIDGNIYSSRQFVPNGNFDSSSSPLDMTTITRSFLPSGQNIQLKIFNTSNSLSQMFSGYHCTTNSECPLRNDNVAQHNVGTIYKNAIFYIDGIGRLVCSVSNSELDSTVNTSSVVIGDPFDYVAIDSRLRYEDDDSSSNPFAIAVNKNGQLKSVTFDGSQDEIPNNFKQDSLPDGNNFVNVSVGWSHGAAIKSDGTVVCWGDNSNGQCNTPSGVRFLHVKCGQNYTVGIKEDGSLAAWGIDDYGQISNLPSGHFIKIDAGSEHSVGIRIDGNPVSWGRSSEISDPPTKMVDVCACGGNVYTLQTDGSLDINNVKPFNVGIDMDGNLVAWGKYEEAFTEIDEAIENLHFSPSVPCVALRGGIRSCLVLGVDSRIYAYGISPSPIVSAQQSPVVSIYKSNRDYFSGGFIIDDCKVFSSNNLVDESSDASAYRLVGLDSNEAMNFTFGLYSYGVTSIPMCDSSSFIQKNPTVHCDKFDKISIVYEDNSLGPWGIMERSSIYLDRYLVDKIPLSSRLYSSFNPAVDSDDQGRRVVVWNSIKDKNYLIEHARSDSHPDYVSDCDIDRIISGSRLLGFDSDPYDPYELEKSLMSCRVNLSFIAPVFSTYFFTISFVDINDSNVVYKVSSSKIEPGKWLVNGSYLPYNGRVLDAGESVVVTYLPDLDDNVFGKTLKVILNYTTEIVGGQEQFQTIKLHNISEGELYNGYGPPTVINGSTPFVNEYFIFEEAGKNSTISIPRQSSSYFESQGTDSELNLIFPDGIDSLPGIDAGSFAKSFLVVLGDDGETSNSIVEASVTFSAPIAAILIDETTLSVTDGEFFDDSNPLSINRTNNISTFQFYSGEYLRLGDDRRTLFMRFYIPRKGSWPGSGEERSRGPKKPNTETLSNQDKIFSAISERNLLVGSLVSSISDSGLSGLGDLGALSSNVDYPFATFRVLLSNSGSASGSVESIFYCANPVEKNCRINAVYKNSSYEQKYVHFKVSVYSDPDYLDSLMVFSSLEDSGLWNIGIDRFPLQGLGVISGSSASVSFNPPVIDPSLGYYTIDSKSVEEYYSLGSSYMDYYNLNRKSFICGVKYYIKVSAIIDYDDIELYRTDFVCECSKKFSDREGLNNWISPYNGSSNVEISKGTSRKSNPSVAGSRGGLFMVAWEDYRGVDNYGGLLNNNNIFSDIYSAIIDLSKNKIESSVYQSQERIVKNTSSNNDLSFDEEKNPIVKSDYFGNFSVFSTIGHNGIKKRHMSVGYKIKPDIIKESAIVAACSFTLTENNNYKSAFEGGEFLDIRISEKYIKGRVFSGKKDPLTVVNDCFVEIEVVGVPGAMAYRVKNESEIDFTDWIPIGSDIQPISSFGEDILPEDEEFRKTFKARWVGNEVFVFPWVLSNGNGVKRICIEILTAFGKTQQICIDVVAEYSGISYSLDIMYVEAGKTTPIFSPIRYKGIPVVNRKTWYTTSTSGDITLSKNDLRSLNLDESLDVDILVKINFEDPDRIKRLLILNNLKRFVERRSSGSDFSLTLYQQGSVVQESTIALDENNGEYFGTFKINKNNGVTFKDGLGFILVNIPFECFNPFVKNFSSVLRIMSDQRLDNSSAKIQDNNKFIENYTSIDKRNLFGTKRINP